MDSIALEVVGGSLAASLFVVIPLALTHLSKKARS